MCVVTNLRKLCVFVCMLVSVFICMCMGVCMCVFCMFLSLYSIGDCHVNHSQQEIGGQYVCACVCACVC